MQLFFYRGCILMYIVCFDHAFWWFDLGGGYMRSLLLIGMPLMFFMSGATSRLAGYDSISIGSIMLKKFRRVLAPYYAYALISVFLVALLSFVKNRVLKLPDASGWLDLFLIRDIPHVHYAWHIWFIPVYALLMVSVPLQSIVVKKLERYGLKGKWGYLAICLAVFTVARFIAGPGEIEDNSLKQILLEVLGYNLFFACGFLFYKQLSRRTIAALLSVSVVVFVLSCRGDVHDLQFHKFQVDWVFQWFGFVVICAFGLLFSYVRIKEFKGLRRWSSHAYTFYLWQNWSYVLVAALIGMFGLADKVAGGSGWHVIWLMPLLYMISYALNYLIVRIEQFCKSGMSFMSERLSR